MTASRTITNECRYEIVRQLHEGGMGVVYEAIQHGARGFQKRVAIKIVRPQLADSPDSSRTSSAKLASSPT